MEEVNQAEDCAELLYYAIDINYQQETLLEAIKSDEFFAFVHGELIPGFSKDSF